jgi:23S rRNA (guanosine2251-2'-O)-methyltransferase
MRKIPNEELGRLNPEEYQEVSKMPVTIVLDNVRSLNNIGSVFRTGDGFRVEKIILCGISTCPPHRDIYKTALGAEKVVPWEYFENTTEAICSLKESGYYIISVEQVEDSTPLPDLKLTKDKPVALVFGHEIKGVSQEVVDQSDECLEIPQYGTKHSFNISVSVGIVLWEVSKCLNLHQ